MNWPTQHRTSPDPTCHLLLPLLDTFLQINLQSSTIHQILTQSENSLCRDVSLVPLYTCSIFSGTKCSPIVWGFRWRLRITCGFAGLWKRRTWPVSSSDCVGISGEVEDCMHICRIVWREVKRGGSGRWRETCRRVGVPGR